MFDPYPIIKESGFFINWAIMQNEQSGIFETLFHSATEGIIIAGATGEIIKANPAAQYMFGYSDSLEGKEIEMLLPEDLREAHRLHRSSYHEHPKARSMGQDLELFGHHKDGSIFPVEVSLSPSTIGDKSVVIAFIIDITERKQREQAELSMGRILDQSINEIIIFDAETLKFIKVNRAAIDNLGYSQEELLSMSPLDICPDFDKNTFGQQINPLKEGRPKQLFETLHQRKDGSTYPVEVHLQLAAFETRLAFIAITMDITARKMAEDKLRKYSIDLEKRVEERTRELQESQKLYRAIAKNFPDGMISVFDEKLRYVFVEGKELHALGITSEMLIGTRYMDRLDPEIAKQTEKELKEVFKGQAKSIDIKFKSNDYVLEAVPIPDERGTIRYILVIEKNITQRKKAEAQMQQALEHERELSDLKSRFVSTASHEFRTPLSTILSSVSLISKYKTVEDEAKREKHIARIKGSVHNLTGILNDFLSLDKLETGAIEGHPVTFDLKTFVQETCDELVPTLKQSQKINYTHQGKKRVFLDQQILKNILLNLLSNASKYSGNDDMIQVTSDFLNAQVLIKVKDQGIGISKEDQKHLFERFFRSKNAFNISGTGLGLNIVKKYVDLIDGSIEVQSAIGKGSTFTVKINQ
jgi:PAS domain S-box-containing protein